jgi:hypothetical protein
MITINARNVNEALPLGLDLLLRGQSHTEVSRGLATIEANTPVATVYRNPWERVLLDPGRDANPFFHFFESMWILSGSNAVGVPAMFLPRITDYSDDGFTFHGAYGFRLRNWGDDNIDQLGRVIKLLRDKPDTRQAVLSIWDPVQDLGATTKDTPCNDLIMLKIRDNKLNMTVCNRSNDVIWGAYGANVVQFSVLQEFIAASVGVYMGTYTQVSDSYHVYSELPLWKDYVMGKWRPSGHVDNPYEQVWASALFRDPMDAHYAQIDAERFVDLVGVGRPEMALMEERLRFQSTAFREVGLHMLQAFLCHKAGDKDGAMVSADRIVSLDWRMACKQWLSKRAGVAT